MRYYFLIISIMLFSCNSNQENEKQKKQEIINNKCFVYPVVVDSLHAQDLYDSARWYVYTLYCDIAYLSKNDTITNKTFGELPMQFQYFNLRNDTLEFSFCFLDSIDPILPSMTRDGKQLLSGVGFNLKSRKKIFMSSPGGYSSVTKGGYNRYENSLQPEVIMYIKNNWNKLDNCFKELAEQKGISDKSNKDP